MNYIYFDAKDWTLNKECKSIGERSFIQDFNNELTEVFQLGDWNYDYDYSYSEINSVNYALNANTPYTFVFWLNGGENDRKDEICRLEVVFDKDEDRKCSYKLNRNFIAPVLKYRGWELYAISFVTPASEEEVATGLRFVSVHAPMAVMAAKDLESYMNQAAEADPYEKYRPQRHNIVFPEGWPTDTWYSTENMAYEYPEINAKKDKKKAPIDKEDIKNFANDFGKEFSQFVTEFTNGAKSFADTVKSTASNIKSSKKTKDAVDKVKYYGTVAGEQVDQFVSEMVSAENQEKMQEVLKKVEGAITDAVAKGDQVGSQILERAKESLQKYRDNKKQAEEEKEAEYNDLVAEQIDEMEDQLDELEDQISDLEDEIGEKEDEADDLDDEVDDLNEEMKSASAEDQKNILSQIKEKLMAKGDILSQLQEDKMIVLKELKERRDDLAKKLHELKTDFTKTEEEPEEQAEESSTTIKIEGDEE